MSVLTPASKTTPAPVTTPPAPITRPGLLARMGLYSARHPRRVILLWAALVFAAAPLAVTLTSVLSGAGWDAQGSTAEQVRLELRETFPELGAEAAIVAYRQDTAISADPAGLATLVAALEGSPGTTNVIDPSTRPAEAGLFSADGRAALVPVVLEGAEDAELPESAGLVMKTVAAVQLPVGAQADATGEARALRRSRLGPAGLARQTNPTHRLLTLKIRHTELVT